MPGEEEEEDEEEEEEEEEEEPDHHRQPLSQTHPRTTEQRSNPHSDIVYIYNILTNPTFVDKSEGWELSILDF